ncbi:NADH-quinone oxidoreductase subunit N [Streptacidiphilus fuscans]|uniref:NADH-quinone oxidoreductase subunit N n=1 Tax=Streptacidiphilus fuscans TaxID=2789292 RepID=A0A931FDA9_9ACTN|nr:NADH-quinone oxidoreductase subunit N [Streptacidiphilus fuscans]MBF9067970.1 NADH-quinone oxidoreductase subunit N [Streptacidiphilus fuscans]
MLTTALTAGALPTDALAAAVPAGSLIQSVDWLAVLPPLVPAVVALVVLVADLFLPTARKPLLGWLSVAGLAASLVLLLPLRAGHRTTFCTTSAGVTSCSYVADHFALAFQLLVLAGALLVALLSLFSVDADRLPVGEFWFLLLASACGAALLPACRDLASLVVALEVTTLPAFALVALRRDGRGGEAALKFFLSSVTATAVTLLGVSFVYAATGSLYLDRIGAALPHVQSQLHVLVAVGTVLTLVGFAFKTAAAPFHFWVPDTYAGAPVPVAAYLSVVGKAAGLAGLAAIAVLGFHSYGRDWGYALAVLAALTMTVGNVGALRQRSDAPHSAVRLLAWSSVAQAGYLLVPIAAAGAGHASGSGAIGSTVAFALIYGLVNLGAFAVVTLGGDRLDVYQGLFARRPAVALAMAFFLLNLAGLPPGVIGLFGKVVVFRAAVDAGLGWLAVIMAVNVVVALYYYLAWTAKLFQPSPVAAPAAARRGLPVALGAAVAVATVLGVVLSVAPQLVLQLASGSLFG